SPVGARFFDLLRPMVGLLNEKEREIWPNPAFPQQISAKSDRLLGQRSRAVNPWGLVRESSPQLLFTCGSLGRKGLCF
ncbi:MAG: hypothetical protein ABR550_07775, partial [Wenzhouxiangellaceae bacterium]